MEHHVTVGARREWWSSEWQLWTTGDTLPLEPLLQGTPFDCLVVRNRKVIDEEEYTEERISFPFR